MDVSRRFQPKRRRLVLSTRRKMNVLTFLNSDSRKNLCDSSDKDSENYYQNVSDSGEVISFLQTEQFHVECLKHLKKCLIHPLVKGSIESSDDMIELVDEMVSLHRNLCNFLVSEKSDMADVLKILLASLDTYVSYSVFVGLEKRNFQKLWEMHTDVYIDFELLEEPMTHISRYKTLFQNLCSTSPDGAFCSILKAVEKTSKNMQNAVLLKNNALRTLQIQRFLFKRKPKILSPGRTVLKEGILYKVNSNGNSLKERVFFLFNDIFLCCKLLSKTSDWHKKDSLMFEALFPLDMCLVSFVMGSSKQGALFKVICGSMSYLILSKVPGEAQSWFLELESAIRSCQRPAVKLKPKLRRQTYISLKNMQRISPFLKKTVRSDSQKLRGDSTNSSLPSRQISSLESIFKLLVCVNV